MSAGTTLRQQQRAFADAVVHVVDAPGLFSPNAKGGAPLLDAYQFAYSARLVGALRDNFEILAQAMGDQAFDALARAYLAAHPSRTPSIRWFGGGLAAFMAERAAADDELIAHPAFVDFARMDWALRDAFDAADAPTIGRDVLVDVAPDDFGALRFVPHPSVGLATLGWAIEAAWRTLRAHDPHSGDEPELPAPTPEPHTLLVWRRALDTQWRSLAPTEAELLRSMIAGDDFATLCERAAKASGDEEQAATIAATALLQWLADGLISARR
ncbi:MAG: putative DNA-binding domain-containing protein [Burkholderiales bacterium]|nr:putative DNA-binding domain-containing protein [Burkholderiales bacterium]